MSVRWDTKRKQFIVDYYDYYENDEGKRIRERKRIGLPRTITDIDLARAIEHDLKKPDENSELNPQGSSTVRELFPRYLEYCELHKSDTTLMDIRNVYRTEFDRHLGNFKMSELDRGHLVAYQRLRKAENVKNRTVNKEASYFMAFLEYCRSELGIPVKEFTFKRLKEEKVEKIVLSLPEAISLIAHADLFYKVFFLCLYSLGLRMKEATGLTWEDLDPQNKVIIVRGKGSKQRILPVSDWLLYGFNLIRPENATGLIFRSQKTTGRINDVRGAIRRAKERAGIDKHITPHILRHTLATHMMGWNINIKVIQKWLGHTKESTTADMYVHADMDHLRGAQGLLDAALDKHLKRRMLKKDATIDIER